MLAIQSDSPEVERSLAELGELVSSEGGAIDAVVQIRSEDNNLSIEARADTTPRTPLIAIPEAVLLPLDEMELRASQDALDIVSTVPTGFDARRRLVELMVEIYNLTHKIRDYRKTSPWMTFASDPELLMRITGIRTAPKVEQFRALSTAGRFDQLLLDGFYTTRAVSFVFTDGGTGRPALMPIIDFMNHDLRSPKFLNQPNRHGGKTLAVMHSRPVADSRECFVSYGRYDALDSYLLYNYVDPLPPFVRSVPLDIVVPKAGTIRVLGRMTHHFSGELPAPLADLRAFLPDMRRAAEDLLEVTHLFIPCGNSPHALRRVLAALIRTLRPGLNDSAVPDLTVAAEHYVVAETERYYSDLRRYLHAYKSQSDIAIGLARAKAMADTQIEKLQRYQYLPAD